LYLVCDTFLPAHARITFLEPLQKLTAPSAL